MKRVAVGCLLVVLAGCAEDPVKPDAVGDVSEIDVPSTNGVVVFHYVGYRGECSQYHPVKRTATKHGAGYVCMETTTQGQKFEGVLRRSAKRVRETEASRTIHIGHSRGGIMAIRMGGADARTHHVFNLMGGWSAQGPAEALEILRPARKQETEGTWWYGRDDRTVSLKYGQRLCREVKPPKHECREHVGGHWYDGGSGWEGWKRPYEAAVRDAVKKEEEKETP